MDRIRRFLMKRSKEVLIVILIITVFLGYVMKKNSRMETDLDEYMPKDHPAFVYSDYAEKLFHIKDGIMIAIEHNKSIYNPGTLKKLKILTKKLQKMPEIKKEDVTSLYTAENIVGHEGTIDVKDFYRSIPKSEEKLKSLREAVRGNDMVYKRLVSEDEKVTIIIARIDDNKFSQKFYERLLKISHSFEGPEKVYVAGVPIVEGTMAYLGAKDMKKMIPIVILVIILVLYLVLRSVKNLIFNLTIVILSTLWAFGFMALFKVPIYSVSTMIPVMLIAIGVADGIHMYSHLELFLRKNPEATREEALKDLFHSMWKPVVITSVTTAAGFISLLTSQVYPIKFFGLFTSLGVLFAMVFSLTVIPAGIVLFGFPEKKKDGNTKKKKDLLPNTFFYRSADLVMKHKKIIILSVIIITALSIYGTGKVWINSSFLDKFEESSDIVQTDRFINRHFGGTNTLNVIFESKLKGKFKDPHILKVISKIQDQVEAHKMAGNSFAITDYLKRMHRVMHEDRESFNKIPDSRDMIAQYLLLYEMSGDPDNLWKVINYEYNRANLSIQIKSDNSKVLKEVISIIEKNRPEVEKSDVKIHYAGSGYKALVFTDLILEGQIKSIILSLFMIIILLALQFKNIKTGLIGSVPIMITTVISFGVMGLFNIPLSTTTALVSSIALGIGIDYAVHFIERYRIYALDTGDVNRTIRLTMEHSGRAILFNAVVVILGFMVLAFSVFPPNRALGSLVSLNMFTSFAGTVTIMLILLYASGIYFKNEKIK